MRTRGYIDGVFGDTVRGWVIDVDDPDRPVRVAARIDGTTHPVAVADERREDLARAGIGTGGGGFRLPLGQELGAGPHRIAVLVDGTAATVPLASPPRVLDADGAPRADIELYEEHDPAPVPTSLTPAHADDVLLAGEHGWLFACPGAGFDLLRGVARPEAVALERLLARVRAIQSAADAAGAPALFAILPDKLFLYPEHVPVALDVLAAGRLAEHLTAATQDDDALRVLDLLPTLLRARAHGRVFNRVGAAPTWLGAFHAYRAVAKAVAPAVTAFAPCPVRVVRTGAARPVGDLPAGPTAVVTWHEAGFGERRTVDGPGAGALEDELAGFAAPAAERVPAVVVHDPVAARVADLLSAHAEPATRLEPAAADPGAIGAQRPGVVLCVVSDAALLELSGS